MKTVIKERTKERWVKIKPWLQQNWSLLVLPICVVGIAVGLLGLFAGKQNLTLIGIIAFWVLAFSSGYLPDHETEDDTRELFLG